MNAIELGLFTSRINAICEQMGAVLKQTAFSPNIRDRLDYSCAIFDTNGRLCAQAAHIPVHLGSMAYAMKDVVQAREWRKGDTLILNNPYMGGTHLPAVTFISPVFFNNKLTAFVANRAHHADIGSETPGSMPISKTLDEEGIIISPVLICENDQIIESVLENIISQLRDVNIAIADFKAQISVNKNGNDALIKLIRSCEDIKFDDYLSELNDYARRIAATTFSQLPDGEYHFTDVMDDDGINAKDIAIHCTLHVNDGKITVDFLNTAKQVEGNINCPIPVTAAAVYYCFRCLMPAYVPDCAGTFDLITLKVPEGCLLNANYPAAVAAGNVETSTRVVDVVLGALAQAIPDKIPAASHGSMNNIAMGSDNWSYYETLGGGMGGNTETAGLSAIQTHMTNTLNTPVEVVETHFPLYIKEYSAREDSGGKGKNPGGNGLIRHYQFIESTEVSLITERRSNQPWGLAGGENGEAGQNLFNGRPIPGKTSLSVKPGDELIVKTAGGGGWGRH
ncbi:MAG: hydantoinase B/oxoprolinase family protein [Proteobacteria bacterium]|nr:hydantoinase B/oxoprolinase family protein [Pseudomonadota bacterium]